MSLDNYHNLKILKEHRMPHRRRLRRHAVMEKLAALVVDTPQTVPTDRARLV